MGRLPKAVEKMKKKGGWSEEEDIKLKIFMENEGAAEGHNWETISEKAGLNRCGKSCRLRWKNYLNPHITRGHFSHQEEQTIIHLQSRLGNKWSRIATELPGRTDNDVKNLWNTKLRKTLQQQAIAAANSSQLQTPIPHAHYNFLENNHPITVLQTILNMPIPELAAKNLLLQEWIRSLQLQTIIDPFLLQPARFQDELSENYFDSNVDGYDGVCSNNINDSKWNNELPALVSATDDEIPVEFCGNGMVNAMMNYEFSPSFVDDASTSNLHDGATCSFPESFLG